MRNVYPRDLENRGRKTLAVWASRMLDSKYFWNQGRLTFGVWVTEEGGLYGFNALAPIDDRIPKEF